MPSLLAHLVFGVDLPSPNSGGRLCCFQLDGLMGTTLDFQRRMDVLSEYMTEHNFTEKLRRRANKYCFYTFEASGGEAAPSMHRTP